MARFFAGSISSPRTAQLIAIFIKMWAAVDVKGTGILHIPHILEAIRTARICEFMGRQDAICKLPLLTQLATKMELRKPNGMPINLCSYWEQCVEEGQGYQAQNAWLPRSHVSAHAHVR